jgi:hypothetical protein
VSLLDDFGALTDPRGRLQDGLTTRCIADEGREVGMTADSSASS